MIDALFNLRSGIGYDVHAFEPGDSVVLGGVKIPFDKALAGHSDADVLIHAVIDSLLGAASMGDIGSLYPDNDKKYLGIDSTLLLKNVSDRLTSNCWKIINIDTILICEKPKLLPYRDDITANFCNILGILPDQFNIKGKTTEKLGFTGRSEGIAAQAVCLIHKV